jgi:Tol biopolymer transport system component
MNGSRAWGWWLGLATLPAHGEVLLVSGPDEWLSRHVADGAVLYPSVSDDARYVAVEAQHPDFSFARVVLVLDRQNLAAPQRAGADCDFALDCELQRPRISGNGRFVVFDSAQSFGGGDDATQSDSDVFVWDRVAQSATRITRGVGGAEPNDESFAGDISRDGRYVVFTSYATNLVSSPSLAGAQRRLRSYWMDRQNQVVKLVYEGSVPLALDYPKVRITANGRYAMAVQGALGTATSAINWDALNATTGYRIDDYWTNRSTYTMTQDRRYVAGVTPPVQGLSTARAIRVDAQQIGTVEIQSDPGFLLGGLDVSAGGDWLAAHAYPGPGSSHRVGFYRRGGGKQLSVLLDTASYSFDGGFDMTPDGRYAVLVAFDQDRPGADPWDADTDGEPDVFLVENRLWTPSANNLVKQFTSVPANSRNVKVSADGHIGVFESEIPAGEFGAYTDANGAPDVFRYLADFQQIELLSTADGANAFPAGARNPAMSGDGEVVLFEAFDTGIAATDIAPPGKAAAPVAYKAGMVSIFMRRLVQNQLQRISVARMGGAPNGNSMNPSISADGRRAAFATDADNINPGADANGRRDVVAVDLEGGTRQCVSSCAAPADGPSDRPAVSNAGDVAFESSAASLQKSVGAGKASGFSQIVLRSLINGSSQIVSRNAAGQPGNAASTRPTISNNGRVVAYQSGASNLDASGSDNRVNVIRTLVGGASQRISRSGGPNGKSSKLADGDSLQPALSGDGRFLAFQTDATTLAGSDTNGVTDLLVYDARSGALRRLSEGYGGLETNGASQTPHLNFNGTRVGFHSFASNLDTADDGGVSATSAPYEAVNPLGAAIVFADAFE